MADRTIAEKTALVNVVLLVICLPLLAVCLLRGLWLPAAVFAFLSCSNGYQLWTAKRPSGRVGDG